MNNKSKRRILFGPLGGLCEAIVMQPLDTIKVRKQSLQYIGLGPTIKRYGVANLYKGLTPFMSQMFIKYGLRFSTYEYLRGNSDNVYKSIFAGACAGLSESLFMTPFELIKTRMQTRDSISNPIKKTLDVIKANGYKGLYRGFSTTCLRQSINQSTNFTLYYQLRNKYIDENDLNTFKVIGCSLFSSSVGPILNNPFDVIKTRYMNTKYDNQYKNIFNAITTIIKNEGISSLYKGIGLRLIRVSAGQAITFSIMENLNSYANLYKFLPIDETE